MHAYPLAASMHAAHHQHYHVTPTHDIVAGKWWLVGVEYGCWKPAGIYMHACTRFTSTQNNVRHTRKGFHGRLYAEHGPGCLRLAHKQVAIHPEARPSGFVSLSPHVCSRRQLPQSDTTHSSTSKQRCPPRSFTVLRGTVACRHASEGCMHCAYRTCCVGHVLSHAAFITDDDTSFNTASPYAPIRVVQLLGSQLCTNRMERRKRSARIRMRFCRHAAAWFVGWRTCWRYMSTVLSDGITSMNSKAGNRVVPFSTNCTHTYPLNTPHHHELLQIIVQVSSLQNVSSTCAHAPSPSTQFVQEGVELLRHESRVDMMQQAHMSMHAVHALLQSATWYKE